MNDFENFTNVIAEDAENVIDNQNTKELKYERTYSVRLPEPEEQIAFKKVAVKKIKTECEKVKNNKFPLAELYLALSTLFLGAFLGALASQIQYEFKFLSILFYTISPAGGFGFFIAYLFKRNKENEDIVSLANKIEEYLPEIDDINDVNGGEQNEY